MSHSLGLRGQPPYHTISGHGTLVGWVGCQLDCPPVGSGAALRWYPRGGPWGLSPQRPRRQGCLCVSPGQPGVGGSERLGSTTVAVGPMRRQSQGTAPNQVKLKVGIGLSVLENDFWCQVTQREEEARAKCTHSLIQTCIPQVLAAKKAAFPECLTFFNLGVHLSFTCSPSSKSPFLA